MFGPEPLQVIVVARRIKPKRPPASAPTTKYAAISDVLRRRIQRGDIVRGQRLPSESALMAEFGVSRVTVRLAIDALRAAGLVESRQGKGHFVRPVRAVQDLGRLQGFGEMMAAVGMEAHSVVLSASEVPCGREVQKALALERNTVVVAIERVRVAGGVPLSYDVSYFPIDVGRRLVALDLAHADIFALIENQLGIELGFADLTLEVVPADAITANHLQVAKGDPLLRIRRLTVDDTRRPIDFEYLYGRPDAFQFSVRVPRR
jgi:GntR family transcriptional regulator